MLENPNKISKDKPTCSIFRHFVLTSVIMSHNPKDQKSRPSNEFFYLVNGVKEDAALHEEMLAEGDARIAAARKNKELSDKLLVEDASPKSTK